MSDTKKLVEIKHLQQYFPAGGRKSVVIDLCIRFEFDPKRRNVGLGVNLPLLLQTQGCSPSFRRAQNRAEIEMLPENDISR